MLDHGSADRGQLFHDDRVPLLPARRQSGPRHALSVPDLIGAGRAVRLRHGGIHLDALRVARGADESTLAQRTRPTGQPLRNRAPRSGKRRPRPPVDHLWVTPRRPPAPTVATRPSAPDRGQSRAPAEARGRHRHRGARAPGLQSRPRRPAPPRRRPADRNRP